MNFYPTHYLRFGIGFIVVTAILISIGIVLFNHQNLDEIFIGLVALSAFFGISYLVGWAIELAGLW